MSLVRRPFVISSPFSFVIALFSVYTLTTYASPQADSTRITSAANVTLRAMPSPDAAAVTQLPLGTEVVETGPAGLEKTWVRVRLADNREGWLQSNMTRPLDMNWRWEVFDRIIADRLNRKGDAFPAAAELVGFIERVAPEYTDPDGRGRIGLARLRALSAALAAVPFRANRREPYASWLAARKAQVTYDEPGGHWMLVSAAVWDIHAQQSATTSADDIAWFAVENGLSGECEGHLPCYLTARDRLQGEYLRRHPFGKHAAEAVGVIKATADQLNVPSITGAAYKFNKQSNCQDVNQAIDALAAAVEGTRVGDRGGASSSLATLSKLCR